LLFIDSTAGLASAFASTLTLRILSRISIGAHRRCLPSPSPTSSSHWWPVSAPQGYRQAQIGLGCSIHWRLVARCSGPKAHHGSCYGRYRMQ